MSNIKKQIIKLDSVKISCPYCGENIISPRLEIQNKINEEYQKYLVAIDELRKYKGMKKTDKLKIETYLQKEEWEKIRDDAVKNIKALKLKRSILSEKENSSVYFALKKAVSEIYGADGYVKCMNRAMEMINENSNLTNFKKINLDEKEGMVWNEP